MQGVRTSFKVALLLLLLFLAGVIFYEYNIFSFGALVDSRLKNLTDGSGRYEIWVNAINLFLERPLGGWGAFSFRPLNLLFWGDDKYAHNTYIEILVETGLLGFLLFSLFLLLLFVRAHSIYSRDRRFGFLIPTYFSFLVGLIFLSLYINTLFLFFVMLYSVNHENHITEAHE